MLLSLPVLAALYAPIAAPVPESVDELPTAIWQIAPIARAERLKPWEIPATPSEKTRAVLLLPGLRIHRLQPGRLTEPEKRSWEAPNSALIKALERDSDVFAFGSGQTVPVDDVARAPGFHDAVARLRKAGYKEIVFVGHSAGCIIARRFVEQFPDAGVTKVIAVAPPFAGAEVAEMRLPYPKVQKPYVHSLTPEARTAVVKANPNAIGKDFEFVCVVTKLKHLQSDGVVPTCSQWPDEVQQQGIPAVLCQVGHLDVMHDPDSVKVIACLVREKVIRWGPEEIATMRNLLFCPKAHPRR